MAGKSTFFRTVKTDFKLGLKLPFLLAVCGVVLGFCFDNWQDLRNFAFSPQTSGDTPTVCVMYYFFNSFSFGGVFSEYFAAIMAAIPFAANYCDEVNGGMLTYKIARCGKDTYARSKFVVASILGGATFALGSLTFILALAIHLPLVTPDQIFETSWLPFSWALTVGNRALYFAIVLCICFLGGSLWGSVGLCASAYFPSSYVAVCAPLIFRFVLVQIGRLLNLPGWLRLDLLIAARETVYSDAVTFLVTAAYVLALILLCYRLFCMRLERSVWNVE